MHERSLIDLDPHVGVIPHPSNTAVDHSEINYRTQLKGGHLEHQHAVAVDNTKTNNTDNLQRRQAHWIRSRRRHDSTKKVGACTGAAITTTCPQQMHYCTAVESDRTKIQGAGKHQQQIKTSRTDHLFREGTILDF